MLPVKPEPIRLPETVAVPRTDPIYNCHAYLTKVPIGAIRPFIETFTKPGEVVADFFAGSGMTGLAALTLNRRARLSDISVLGQHIATGYLTDAPARDIRAAAHRVMAVARNALGPLYMTKRGSDGANVEMIRTIWSFTYLCPSCGDEMVFHEALTARGGVPRCCPSCGGPFARRSWPRGEDVPVEVVVQGGRTAGKWGKTCARPTGAGCARHRETDACPRCRHCPSRKTARCSAVPVSGGPA